MNQNPTPLAEDDRPPAAADQFGLLVREGCYDPMAPRERSVKVVATVPDLPPVTLLLPTDAALDLLGYGVCSWPELAQHALKIREAIGATPRADVTRFAEWLAVEANWDAYTMAWAAHRARSLRRRAKKTLVLLGEHCRHWGIPLSDADPSVPAIEQPGYAESDPLMEDVLICAESLETFLSVWATRDNSKAQPQVRTAANDVMAMIDRLLRDLHTLRDRTHREIRESDDIADARVDALLAKHREAGTR